MSRQGRVRASRRFIFTRMQRDNETHRIANETISTNMTTNTIGYANINYMFARVHVCLLQVYQRVHESVYKATYNSA